MSDFRIRIAYYYVLIVRFKRSYAQNKIKEDIYTRDVFIRKTQKYMQFASKIKRLWIFYRPSYNYQQLKQWQKRDGKFLKSVKSLKIRLNILRGYCDFSYREILRRRTIIIALNKSQTSILSKPYLADRKYHLFRDSTSTSSFSSSSTSLVRYYLENPGGSQPVSLRRDAPTNWFRAISPVFLPLLLEWLENSRCVETLLTLPPLPSPAVLERSQVHERVHHAVGNEEGEWGGGTASERKK